jgi:hypothetical protein
MHAIRVEDVLNEIDAMLDGAVRDDRRCANADF